MTEADGPVVSTSEGKVQGTYDGEAIVFRGIPYAAPPVGPLRFKPPVRPAAWDGVRPCVEFGAACPQIASGLQHKYGVPEPLDEDCLFLNVWTSAVDDERRPVMVFVHGGANILGSGGTPVYNGARTAMRGAVVVTINYRLGALGFLHLAELLPGYEGSGNAGILDTVRALEWVKENIASFGGDPDRITVLGSSAGGLNLTAAITMPAARGLVRRAIPMSSVAGVHRTAEQAAAGAIAALEAVGLDARNAASVLDIPAAELVARMPFPHLPALAVVDGAYLPDAPYVLISQGATDAIDILVGSTTEERRNEVLVDMTSEAAQFKDLDYSDLATLLPWTGLSDAQIRAVYEPSVAASGREPNPVNVWAAALSDRMIVGGIAVADARLGRDAPTYMYRMAWRSPAAGGEHGAYHGVPTPFVFDNPDLPTWRMTLGEEPPRELSRLYNKALIAFAATGSPAIPEVGDWPRYELPDRWTMEWDLEPRMVRDPDAARRELYAGAPQTAWQR
jgi:para-nitrobenzyl esterase